LRAIFVRKSTADPGSTTAFAHDPLQRIVGADLLAVDVKKGAVGQRSGHANLLDDRGNAVDAQQKNEGCQLRRRASWHLR
jgi:hypothetical protein